MAIRCAVSSDVAGVGMGDIEIHCEQCNRLCTVTWEEVDSARENGSQLLCPECKAHIEASNERQCFEYCSIPQLAEYEMRDTMLNDFGKEGWELVAVISDRFIFKRSYFE